MFVSQIDVGNFAKNGVVRKERASFPEFIQCSSKLVFHRIVCGLLHEFHLVLGRWAAYNSSGLLKHYFKKVMYRLRNRLKGNCRYEMGMRMHVCH